MQKRQILSAPAPAPARSPSLVFDACEMGVVLRAVLYVLAVMGVGLMYVSENFADWFRRVAFASAGALPATLLWIVIGCGMKRTLARLTPARQIAAGMVLGAVCGLFASAALALVSLDWRMPWLASAATGALLAAGLVAGLIWRVRGRTPAAVAARLAELQARIRPHFLFNTLNTAIELVHEEPDKAELVLADLADLFHSALVDPHERSTVAREIELARQYLEIEQIRFGARLRVRWKLDAAAGRAHLPPLILQPLVENAIRHGVEPSPDGADVAIVTQARGRVATIEVSNSMPAGSGRAGHGMALANVRDRLYLLHDVQSRFRHGLHGGAYRVRIDIPLPAGGQ